MAKYFFLAFFVAFVSIQFSSFSFPQPERISRRCFLLSRLFHARIKLLVLTVEGAGLVFPVSGTVKHHARATSDPFYGTLVVPAHLVSMIVAAFATNGSCHANPEFEILRKSISIMSTLQCICATL